MGTFFCRHFQGALDRASVKGMTFDLVALRDRCSELLLCWVFTPLRARQMCWEHRTEQAPFAQREAEWWQGQQHCFLDYVHKDRTQFVKCTVLDRVECWLRRLYCTHSTRKKCIQMHSDGPLLSVFHVAERPNQRTSQLSFHIYE